MYTKGAMMMKWNTLRYLFKEGIIGLWKNRTMALASIGTIMLCLLILGMSYSIEENINSLLQQVEGKFGITCYIEDGTIDDRIDEIQKEIQGLGNISEVTYISKEEALKNFSEGSEDDSLFEDFREDNPLPASFEIFVIDIESQDSVVSALEKIPELDVNYLQSETDMFIRLNRMVSYVCLGIIVCLIVVGLFLMSNTIRLTVYIRRKEINIMKYIGATDSFIRLPFVIEGILIGLIGSLISIGVLTISYDWIYKKLMINLAGLLQGLQLVPVGTIMVTMIPICLGLGIGIGIIGSASAIHKHLNV